MTTFTKEQLMTHIREEIHGWNEVVKESGAASFFAKKSITVLEIAQSALTAPEAFESWFIEVHLPGIRQSQLKAAECKLVHRVAQSAWNGCCSAILEGDDK